MNRVSAALLSLGLASACLAQRSPTGATSRTLIAMMPDVHKELKVTKDQDKQIQDAMRAKQQAIQSGGAGGLDFSDPMAGMDIDLAPILDAGQLARLEELFVQANSGFALADAKVAAALVLSEDQVAKAKQAKSDASKELMQKLGSARSQGAFKEMQKRRDELALAMLDILTPEQKTTYEALKGKPFKFKT